VHPCPKWILDDRGLFPPEGLEVQKQVYRSLFRSGTPEEREMSRRCPAILYGKMWLEVRAFFTGPEGEKGVPRGK
jgi:hypothetical protein